MEFEPIWPQMYSMIPLPFPNMIPVVVLTYSESFVMVATTILL